ncbi:MAG: LptA/OstA family protein, partial [Pyrinomonadaceae bacterium]
LQTGYARGNAYLKQSAPDRVTEVSANELNAFFGDNQQIQKSNAKGSANVVITPSQSQNYSKATVFAPQALSLLFRPGANQGVLNEIQTDGRTAIVMSAAQGNPNSTNRKISGDSVKTSLADNGIDIVKAEAVGNGEIYVEPIRATADNYKTTITASRFDCDFYPGNNAKLCTATGKGKAVMTPMIAAQNRGTRTLTADKLAANFNQNTQDVERFDAVGNAKFTELDRNGIADQIVYTAGDGTARLRGGEPTLWDSQARAKASEIDWNTNTQKSFLRGKVSTTYYSQKQTNGAAPFAKSNAPVFITANEAQFDHQTQVGVYLGNARAWQENNYVRAEKLVFQENAKRMDGEGKVQSLLYNVQRKEGDKISNQPAFASSDRIAYLDGDKHLRYEGNVDIRQGTDRLLGGVADIFLNENNEAKQTIVENNVIITQPNRRITGNWAQYTIADETIVLRGNPATVADAESGTSQGSQMTISLRDNKVVNQGAAKSNAPGRTRSVYKVKP